MMSTVVAAAEATALARDDLVKFLRATGHEPRIEPVGQGSQKA